MPLLTATFAPATHHPRGARPPVGITKGDLDGDGDADLATVNHSGSVSVPANRGDGTFGTARSVDVGKGPQDIVAANLAGDRGPDMTTADTRSAAVSVLVNTGPGR